MLVRALALSLLAVLLLPGCSLVSEPQERELAGPTDGHQPTPNYLKVFVRRDDGTMALVDFDRRDWYTAEIARRIDRREVEFLSATVMPRNTLNEYLVQRVTSPADLASLRYDEMEASPEMRAQMDAEYEQLLKEALDDVTLLPTPTALLPQDALP